jgi:phosphoenolpyruvate carboxylase
LQQAYTLKKIREGNAVPRPLVIKSKSSAAELVSLNPTSEYGPGLEDTVILTMKGIAAGMQNTG